MIVRAVKRVRAWNRANAEKFAKEVQIHVERRGKEIKIYKKHPKPPSGIGIKVNYEIQCPSTVDVNLTASGKIEINGVEGAVDARTTNGKIELHGGAGRIHTVTRNGKIEASVKQLTEEGTFVTSNQLAAVDVEIREGVAPGVSEDEQWFNQLEVTGRFLWSA